jgi:plasmid stabilization system protein ParE
MMRLPLIILPPAEQDILTTVDDYNARRPGLGHRFLSHVERTFGYIHQHPYSYQQFDGEFRRAVLGPAFPYAAAYRIFADNVEVIAVFHCSDDPRRLSDRLTR